MMTKTIIKLPIALSTVGFTPVMSPSRFEWSYMTLAFLFSCSSKWYIPRGSCRLASRAFQVSFLIPTYIFVEAIREFVEFSQKYGYGKYQSSS